MSSTISTEENNVDSSIAETASLFSYIDMTLEEKVASINDEMDTAIKEIGELKHVPKSFKAIWERQIIKHFAVKAKDAKHEHTEQLLLEAKDKLVARIQNQNDRIWNLETKIQDKNADIAELVRQNAPKKRISWHAGQSLNQCLRESTPLTLRPHAVLDIPYTHMLHVWHVGTVPTELSCSNARHRNEIQ